MPIEEVLKNRSTAMLLMAMAVLVARRRGNVFRGYLYPLFANPSASFPAFCLPEFSSV